VPASPLSAVRNGHTALTFFCIQNVSLTVYLLRSNLWVNTMNTKKGLMYVFLVSGLAGCGGSSDSTKGVAINPLSTADSSITQSPAVTNPRSSTPNPSNTGDGKLNPALLSYGDTSKQIGELRLPQLAGDKPSPLVIIIHGGCWASVYADYHFMDEFARRITALGYATWNIEYRTIGSGGEWPVIFQDINRAVDYARDLAQHYPIDVSRVAIIGHSAGGHLALWAGSRQIINSNSELFTPNPLPIKGILSLAGIADITSLNGCGTLANNVIGIPINSTSFAITDRVQVTSPLQMLPSKTKTILISGGADGVVPAAIGARYTTNAVALGDDSSHYILQGLNHFDLIDPNKTNWSLYQQALRDFFKD
jgi:pimeloyl-ACP methyl ester carboxylesterase